LGANDIIGHELPSAVADELATFIQDLQSAHPDLAVLVAQYPPCRSSSEWCQQDWPAYNREIASFARLSTDRSSVIVVDMCTGFSLDDLGDSVHPNDAGDEEMASRWMSALSDSGVLEAASGTN
jgi:lysophospholipase L1-like esterase